MTTPDEHRRNAIAKATIALHDANCEPDCGESLTTMDGWARWAQIAYDATAAHLPDEAAIRADERAKTAEEIALIGDQWAADTIDQRAAPAYEAMAEVARIIGAREVRRGE